ncbi:hypothetical protein [Nonomuraea rubra]|uniref:Uncharacterized protein n=1 Tax=Nonomuraea rubra TaxID=46180 RepID=A0A7X0P8N6_9ACTN|nr:hypothetical protein [Nonomuraea rubra]MBB6557092.1 hypothetical protein [Nonomuraea rubra]
MAVTEDMHDGITADLQDETSPLTSITEPKQTPDENDVLEGTVVLVDQPHRSGADDLLAELAARRQERSPLVPVWLRSRADALQVLKWQAEHTGYVFTYHLLRTPKYAAKLLARTPAGAWRALAGLVRWLFDLEGHPVRRAAVAKEQAAEYLALSKQRDSRVKARLWTLLTSAIALLLASTVVTLVAPAWVHWATVGILIAVLGAIGSPADKPLLDRAVVPTRVRKLTSDQVLDALGSLGISAINQALGKKGRGITFPARSCAMGRAGGPRSISRSA